LVGKASNNTKQGAKEKKTNEKRGVTLSIWAEGREGRGGRISPGCVGAVFEIRLFGMGGGKKKRGD